jgi:chromosome segregation ATPase
MPPSRRPWTHGPTRPLALLVGFPRVKRRRGAGALTEACLLRRLLGGDYTEDDVREILDSLCSVLKADMGTELEHAAHTNVLVLQQLFQQAEGMGLNFSVDTGALENQSLLGDLKQFEADMNERKAQEARLTVSRGPELATLSKAGDAAGHLDLVRRNNELEDEVRQWKDRFETLKEQSLGMARKHSALGSEREALASQFEAMSLKQQQAMMQMQQQQQELGHAQQGASAALTLQQQLEAANSDLRETQDAVAAKLTARAPSVVSQHRQTRNSYTQ